MHVYVSKVLTDDIKILRFISYRDSDTELMPCTWRQQATNSEIPNNSNKPCKHLHSDLRPELKCLQRFGRFSATVRQEPCRNRLCLTRLDDRSYHVWH